MNRHHALLSLLLIVLALAGVTFGQSTVGGTVIESTASATFVDSTDAERSTESNIVETLVLTVYAFEVTPDDGLTPTESSDFLDYVESDGLNDVSAAAGETVTFTYTVTNYTNNDADAPVAVSLDVVQDSGDDFDLENVTIEVSADDGVTFVTYDGDSGVIFYEQGASVLVRVTGDVPSGVDGNEVALIDLVAINNNAVNNSQTGANVSFETNNIARVTVAEAATLGIAKSVEDVTNVGDGTYEVTYLFTLKNYGNVELSSVQVLDDLTASFPSPATFSVVDAEASGTLTVNESFDGDSDTELLVAASSTLAIGVTETIRLTLSVTPGADLGPYLNSASASAQSPDGADVSDLSSDGTDPDQGGDDATNNGDGDPTNTDSATPVTFTENPAVGLAKAASDVEDAVGFPGEFVTTITFTIKNYGDVELRNLQITDVLTDTFPSPVTFVVTSAPASDTLTGNEDFDGEVGAGANILAGSDTLAVDATATVSFTVRFNPNGETGPFDNSASASGTSPAGENVTDDSASGTDPDADGDGDPNNDSEPTRITFGERARIGLAKSGVITDFGPNGVGPFTLQIDFTLRNYGNVALTDVTLADDLDSAFGSDNYSVTSAPSVVSSSTGSVIVPNEDFDGDSDIFLIAADSGSSLPIGGEAVVRVIVVIDAAGTYSNQATASGTAPSGESTSDLSTSGADPDADEDGDPSNDSLPTVWNLDLLALTKSGRSCADAACSTVLDASAATIKPGEYIAYTIVGSASGDLTDVVITDPIPQHTLYVLASITGDGECSTDGGATFSACPTTSAGPYSDANENVTHLRWSSSTLAAGTTLSLDFVVRVK
jgi:uncharacterized repeat protein (TIGR01451 family)